MAFTGGLKNKNIDYDERIESGTGIKPKIEQNLKAKIFDVLKNNIKLMTKEEGVAATNKIHDLLKD